MALLAHERSLEYAKDDWITPKAIIDSLGPFDLDPCALTVQPWPTAERTICLPKGGLTSDWTGLVWMNPPYGRDIGLWTSKLADYGNGVLLIFARVETKWFFRDIWCKAQAIFFVKRRITFHRPDGSLGRWTSGGPSCLVAYGQTAKERVEGFDLLPGVLVTDWGLKGGDSVSRPT